MSLQEQSKHLDLASAPTLAMIRHDGSRAPKRIAAVFDHIEHHLFDEGLSARAICAVVGNCESHVRAEFRRFMGVPLAAYIVNCRLEAAARLLTESRLGLTRIAELVGYAKLDNFRMAFTKWCGLSPRAFRDRIGSTLPGSDRSMRFHRPGTFALRRRALAGDLTQEELQGLLTQLHALYPDADELQQWRDLVRSSKGPSRIANTQSASTYGPEQDTSAQLESSLPAVVPALTRPFSLHRIEAAKAEAAWLCLTQHCDDERPSLIRSWVFKTSALFEILSQHASSMLQQDAAAASAWAQLAQLSLDQIDADSLTVAEQVRLQVRAWTLLSHAQRLRFDLHAADRSLVEASAQARAATEWPHAAPLLQGEVDRCRAALRWYQRRLPAARDAIAAALQVFRQYGTGEERARTLLLAAEIHTASDEPDHARQYLEEALLSSDPERSPALNAAIHQSRAALLLQVGEPEEAKTALGPILEKGLGQGSDSLRRHVRWLQGCIDSELGHLGSAAVTLEEVQHEFIAHTQVGNAALVGLDLAIIRLKQGKKGLAARITRDSLAVFSRLGSQGETLAALDTLRQALEHRTLTNSTLCAVRRAYVVGPASPAAVIGRVRLGP